jgi:hypothetical protein
MFRNAWSFRGRLQHLFQSQLIGKFYPCVICLGSSGLGKWALVASDLQKLNIAVGIRHIPKAAQFVNMKSTPNPDNR